MAPPSLSSRDYLVRLEGKRACTVQSQYSLGGHHRFSSPTPWFGYVGQLAGRIQWPDIGGQCTHAKVRKDIHSLPLPVRRQRPRLVFPVAHSTAMDISQAGNN